MYVLEGDVRELKRAITVRSVRLLPAFDQYVVAATKHAEELMSGAFANRVYRPQGWLSAVLLVNGRIDGVWKHERKASAWSSPSSRSRR
jgi:Winged helix DNA-binding domain